MRHVNIILWGHTDKELRWTGYRRGFSPRSTVMSDGAIALHDVIDVVKVAPYRHTTQGVGSQLSNHGFRSGTGLLTSVQRESQWFNVKLDLVQVFGSRQSRRRPARPYFPSVVSASSGAGLRIAASPITEETYRSCRTWYSRNCNAQNVSDTAAWTYPISDLI